MKSFIAIAAISFGLLLSVQSCLTCTKCNGPIVEAKCVKPNDTLIFNKVHSARTNIHRYYPGGDSTVYLGSSGFDKTVQQLTDSGYTCTTYSLDVAEVKRCNGAGESDDYSYVYFIGNYGSMGYACQEYKGH